MPKRVYALPYSTIYDNIIDGFTIQLSRMFGNNYDHKLKVVKVENDDALLGYANKTNQDKIGFPFFGFKYNSQEERTGEFNNVLFRREGITMKNAEHELFQVQLIPININMTVYFLCNQDRDVRLYAQRWFDCAKLHLLNYEVDISGLSFTIRVECDATYSFPDFQTGQQDIVDMYNVESNAVIHGYYGSITALKPITKYNVNVYDVYSPSTHAVSRELLWSQEIDVKDQGLYSSDRLIFNAR